MRISYWSSDVCSSDLLTGTGGLLDESGRVIDSINLGTEYDELLAQPWLHSGMRVKVEQIHDLLAALPPSSSVSITRPEELAKDLLTHKGSGTLVRPARRLPPAERSDRVAAPRSRDLTETALVHPLPDD